MKVYFPLVLLLILASCSQPILNEEKNLSYEELTSIFKQAEEQNNPELCDQISAQPANVCAMIYSQPLSLAAKTNCFERNNCVSGIMAKRAVEAKDASMCKNVLSPDWVSSCYRDVAIRLGDPSLCVKAEYSMDHDNCIRDIAIAKRDLALCRKSKEFEDMCYYDFALKLNQLEACQNIPESEGNLRFNCILNSADDASDCAVLPIDWQDACMRKVQS